MNGETVGEIKYDARIDTSKLQSDGKRAEAAVKGAAGGAEKAVKQSSSRMQDSLGDVTDTVVGLGASYLSIQGLSNFLSDSIDEANRYSGAMMGLTTVSRAYQVSAVDARTAARQLAADGLMSVTEAATSLKNLLATGFSLDEAITLITRFKDTAAFGRQSALGFGEAIRGATEGIKNGNSILVDNAGVTKNLSVILQEAGKSQQDVMNITSDASVRQALYNGLLRETNAQLGDSTRLASGAAGADAALAVQTSLLQARVGALANTIRQPLVRSLTDFIATNQQSIISVGSGVVAVGAFAAGAYAGVKAIAVLRASLTLLAAHPAIAVISLTFGLFAGAVINKMITNLESAGDSMYDLGDATGGAANQMSDLSGETDKLNKQLAKIDDQMAKTQRDFRESLAEMVRDHEQTIRDITKQMAAENLDYQKAYSDRLSQFEEEQDKEAATHQEKITKLQSQIDFLRRYNNASNAQQLSDLQFALAKENAAYQQKLDERQVKYDEDAAYEKQKHGERVSQLQTRLTAETDLLSKHAADVASIRDVQLLDEIEKLKRSRDEQIRSFEEQKREAIESSSEAAKGVVANYAGIGAALEKDANFESMGNNLGQAMGDGLKQAFSEVLTDIGQGIKDYFKGVDERVRSTTWKDFLNNGVNSLRNISTPTLQRRASGGPVRAGMPYLVGENRDGSLNSTSELFVPNRSGTIVPSGELQSMLQPQAAPSITFKLDLKGVMTSSPAEERALAKRLIGRFNEELRAKNLPELGGGRA
jgi:hypothetical protein